MSDTKGPSPLLKTVGAVTVAAAMVANSRSGCGGGGVPVPVPTPTVVTTPTAPASTPTQAPAATPTEAPVAAPVLCEWRSGIHGGKLVVDNVRFSDGTSGPAFLADSTHHYTKAGQSCPHAWPDVCDGREPSWTDICGKREWNSPVGPSWVATNRKGKTLRTANVGGQPYAKWVEYAKGMTVSLHTCPIMPLRTDDADPIPIPVKGDGCSKAPPFVLP